LQAASLYVSQQLEEVDLSGLKVVFASSFLNLTELLAIEPLLTQAKTILYFHENQLGYPSRNPNSQEQREFHYGWAQVMSALSASSLLFNSLYNLNSFCEAIPKLLKKPTGFKLKSESVVSKIRSKSDVLYFPVSLP